jgi:hypothetical protein
MTRRLLLATAASLLVFAATACNSTPDLTKALTMTEVLGGYYDDGIKDGKTRMVPSLTFRLHNSSDQTIGPLQLTVAFWQEGADGEWNSVLIRGIGAEGLKAGQSTEPLVARNPNAYTPEGGRQDLFTNSMYKDVVAKVFASQRGAITKLGEFKLDRVILPHMN